MALATGVAALVLGGSAVAASASTHSQKLTNVTLQLKWVTQAQFAGS